MTVTATKDAVRQPYRAIRLGHNGFSMRYSARAALMTGLLLVATLLVMMLEIGTGAFPIALADVAKTLLGQGGPAEHFIVVTLRLPRALVGALVGAALGVSGAVFQSLSRNPLGSPDVIGFTTGAATGAVLEIVVWHGGPFGVAGGALIGGLATAAVVYLLAYRKGIQGFRLILVGVGISSILASVNAYLLLRANIGEAQQAYVWLTGSLNSRGWEHVRPVAAAMLVLLPALVAMGRPMRLLEMGDDAAKGLGIRVEARRGWLIVLGTALTAVAVASAGPIAFVALAAPQLARRLVGTASVGLIPAAVMGSLLLVGSDLVAQRLFAPTQLPVGVATVSVGGIYLCWLLLREYRGRRG
jgi:iron complex transport system permease protein